MTSPPHALAGRLALPALVAAPPRWLVELLGETVRVPVGPDRALFGTASVRRSADLSLVEIDVPDVTSLEPAAFQDRVARVYSTIGHVLADQRRYAIRFWSYVPDIHASMGGGLDRYVVFNAGRYRAFTSWYGTPQAFDHTLATASAVGVEGDTLTVHCLAADRPGTPIENPRQIPSYHYSARYGPRPPCFARATRPAHVIGGREVLLVGGTASIVGEQSQHTGDIAAQTRETLTNLDALLRAANVANQTLAPEAGYRFTDLRAYVVHPGNATYALEQIHSALPDVEHVEIAHGKICRRELLVEIEGIAVRGRT